VEELKADFWQQLADRLFNRGLSFYSSRTREKSRECSGRRVPRYPEGQELDYDVKIFG
jgi:hypothetical protein